MERFSALQIVLFVLALLVGLYYTDFFWTTNIIDVNFILKVFLLVVCCAIIIYAISGLAELINRTDMLDKSSKFFDEVRKRIRNKKEDYDKPKRDGNYAFAILFIEERILYYAAHSKFTFTDEKAISFPADNVKYCGLENITGLHCPVERLNSDLEFKVPLNDRYAGIKKHCCERKIAAQIKNDFSSEQLSNSRLILYTSFEPCIYCYNILLKLAKNGVKIELFYDDMLNDMIAQIPELKNKVGEIINGFTN